MGDRHVAADQVQGELHDHPDAAQPSAVDERGLLFRCWPHLEFGHVGQAGKRRSRGLHSALLLHQCPMLTALS